MHDFAREITPRGETTMPPTVLVIDDDEDIRWLVGEVLEQAGFEVSRAAGGAEAMARLAGGLRPALVMLDLMMPGMNGWQVHAAIRGDPALAAIPVVIMSSVAGVAQEAAELGANAHLAKPFDLHDLVAMARRHARA
jgi:CheY-like chemotaxis protein